MSTPARLDAIADPTTGGSIDGMALQKIDALPLNSLHQKQELAMIIFIDRRSKRVSLEVPNKLGWRYHFGYSVDVKQQDPSSDWQNALECGRSTLRDVFGGGQNDCTLRPAGLMLFTFKDCQYLPMRVRIFESATVIDSGKPYSFEDVPYDHMWEDDKFWMPQLLETKESYFEGHFVFQGPPGPSSPLVKHNVQFLESEAVESTS